ncbi:ABC-three component system middle component 6 [Caldalkalibacillus horti]
MNINLSVLNVAYYIVTSLKVNKIMNYDELLMRISRNFEDDIKDIFILALTFLYSLGVISYDKKKDNLELLI